LYTKAIDILQNENKDIEDENDCLDTAMILVTKLPWKS
jgi:hypothetical protein